MVSKIMGSSNSKKNSIIPKVKTEITSAFIKAQMIKLNIGYIYSIIENPLNKNIHFKRIHVKLKWTPEQLTNANSIYSKLKKGETIQYIYGNIESLELDYFKLVANRPNDKSSLSNTHLEQDFDSCDSANV